MNKKHEMVSELTKRIELAKVELPTEDLLYDEPSKYWAKSDYWERYPQGHSRDGATVSIESTLACLSEDSLARILADDKIQDGIAWVELWRLWGRAGYFECAPRIIHSAFGAPTLRMRHDCYLHLFRGVGFQNSMDITDNGSNGESGKHLEGMRGIICLPEESSLLSGECDEEAVKENWMKTWAVWRAAMIYSFPFQACMGKKVFLKLLRDNVELFDRFMVETDACGMHFDLDASVGVKQIYEAAKKTTPVEFPVLSVPLVEGKGVIAIADFAKDAVSVTWSILGARQVLTLRFPEWDREAFERELECLDLACDTPTYASESNYYYYCWTQLADVLLVLSGMSVNQYYAIRPKGGNWDRAPMAFYPRGRCADGLSALWDRCYEYCTQFKTMQWYRKRSQGVEG